jgi:carboxyl-terminal processing protease
MPAARALTLALLSLCVVLAFGTGRAAAQAAPERPMPLEEMQNLAAAYEMLRTQLADPVANPELLVGAIRGMVRHADPEGGEFFTEAELKARTEPLPPHIGWTGLELGMRGFQVTLLTRPESPATRAGVQAGDVLLAVDGRSVRGLDVGDVVPMLRGPVGSRVRLTVQRAGRAEPLDLEIERHRQPARAEARVTRPSAELVVLRMLTIDDGALALAVELLQAQWEERPFKGLVLDLRGNTGGPLNSTVGLAAAFLPRSVVVGSTSGRTAQSGVTFKAQPSDYQLRGADPLAKLTPALRQVPLAVLVDGGTASGAEIVTAALREQGRAVVVGRPTFGRGSIQTQMRLPNGGAVKLTTAYWLTPQGQRIHKVGLTPDVIVPAGDAEHELAQALSTLKARLPS